ncbi:hypothetical protein WA026_008218 [Henosepilachna vigintioctopunctata]|uniref:Uncharacterized protein n=1 Tax=Henosepilachna vigintioctopunctata TaxID=420089 RepID=A0AAW1TIQ9_9CUCU
MRNILLRNGEKQHRRHKAQVPHSWRDVKEEQCMYHCMPQHATYTPPDPTAFAWFSDLLVGHAEEGALKATPYYPY